MSHNSLKCGHIGGKQCKTKIRQNQQQVPNEAVAEAQARTVNIDGVVLKKVENFKYFWCQISTRDVDSLALFINLAKVQKRLARICHFIARERADSAIGGRIYVASVLAVLLYSLIS